MRKVLSFVLVLALVLGSFSMAFASYSDMAGEDSSEAVDVLSALGVVSGYPDGTFGPDKIVTRAEMAKLIVTALGLGDFATGTSSMYSDMAGHWANGYVAYATSLGIITGYPDGTFKPEATVTYEEACAMIVRAIGYTAEFLPGGWPAEWVVKAKALGILDNVTFGSGQGANRGDIAQMLYDALEVAIGYVTDDGWRLYEGDGRDDTDTMLTRLGAEVSSDASIIWGDEDTLINLRSYVGAYASTYTLDGDIIAVIPESIFLMGDYDGDGTFEGDDDVDYIISTSDAAYDWTPVFYNGEYDHDCDLDSHATDVAIAVDLSGKTIKELYSISEWELTNHFMIDEDILEEFGDDETMNGSEFMMDDDDEIDMMSFELMGADSFADLEEDFVVYIYDGDDYIRRIEVGTEVVTGDITKISSDMEEITVGGKVYEYAAEGGGDEFAIGDNVTLTLDYFGDIYDLENNEEASGGSYAVMLETADMVDGTLADPGNDALVDLFLADGTDKVFSVDEDLVNDIISEGAFNYGYVGISPAGIIIEYGLDDDGVIDFMEVVEGYFAYDDVTSKGYYDGTPIAAGAVIFTFTETSMAAIEDFADADNYDVIEKSDIVGVDDVPAWYFEEDNSIEVMMVFEIDDVTTSDEVYGVVVDAYQSTASETDYVVEMLIDGDLVAYDADEDVYDAAIMEGFNAHFFILDLNASGELIGLEVVTSGAYDAEWMTYGAIADYANGAAYDSDDNKLASIDSEAIIYYYDDPFEVVSTTRTNLEEYWAAFFDLDGDNVADVILTFDGDELGAHHI
jgi:hypothetical protein